MGHLIRAYHAIRIGLAEIGARIHMEAAATVRDLHHAVEICYGAH